MADLSEEQIQKLSAFADALPDDDLEQISDLDVDQIASATGTTRRQVLQVAIGLAAGGVLGGLSTKQIIAEVQGQASTSDSDGNVGTPNDRVDVYADGVEANSFSADELSGAWAGKVLVISGSSGVTDVIDPATTTTPIGDALTAASAGDTISIPAGSVTEESTINWKSAVSLETRGAYNGATIDMSSVTGTLMSFDGMTNAQFEPFRLVGPGNTATATDALVFENTRCDKLHFESVSVRDLYGSAIVGLDAGHYQISFDSLFATNIDAGDVNGVIDFGRTGANAGPAWKFGEMWVYPSPATSGANSAIVYTSTGAGIAIGNMNIGGAAGQAVVHFQNSLGMSIYGKVNYEPNNQQSTPSGIFQIQDSGFTLSGAAVANGNGGGSATDFYRVRGGGGSQVTVGRTINTFSLTNTVDVESDITDPFVYGGPSADVTNSTGSTLTSQVACLGDLTTVS